VAAFLISLLKCCSFCQYLTTPIFDTYRPGQEEGNIPFVENAGFGKYSADPIEIAKIVSSWLASPNKLQELQQSALKSSRPHATLDIAQDIAAMVLQEKTKQYSKDVSKTFAML
jgi:UDP-N-acetylglucosamine:LPS N-acetylglucosamine transferase